MSDEPPKHVPTEDAPLLVVLSGPSGVGKNAVLSTLRTRNAGRPWHFAVTATTRPKRPNETNGVDYIFLGRDEFHRMVGEGEFLEHAQVYENLYGVPKQQIRDALANGQDVILQVDVQGASTIKGLIPQAVFIFLVPPSMEELRSRLTSRATESPEALDIRIGTARKEMDRESAYDYRVVNREGCLDDAAARIESIILAEKCRVPSRHISF